MRPASERQAMHIVLKRAVVWFLLCTAFVSAIAGAILWEVARLSNPCPADGMLDGRAVICYYRVHLVGLNDWPWILAALVFGFVACVVVSWWSFRRGSSRAGTAR